MMGSILLTRTQTYFHFPDAVIGCLHVSDRLFRARFGGRWWSLGSPRAAFSRAPPAPLLLRYVYFKLRVIVLAVNTAQLFRWPWSGQ
jgi:hypothetical protein